VKLRGWAVARLVVVAIWIVAAAAAWWTAPRIATVDHLRADIAAGRVVSYQWGDSWSGTNPRELFRGPDLESRGTLGPYFVWRTADDRVHWTDTSSFGPDTEPAAGPAGRPQYAGAGAATIGQELAAAHLDDRQGSIEPFKILVDGGSLVLGLGMLIVLVFGPAPVRGTKWYWFWIVNGMPLGLGVLLWTFFDRPWAAAEPPIGPGGVPRARHRWWEGLLIGILGSLAVGVALWIGGSVFGDGLVPLYR
jgi:hypothetical protein